MEQLPLFVYGTLRFGQPNSQLLDGRATWRRGAVLPAHALYGRGRPFPYATPDPDSQVLGDLAFPHGALYDDVLATLDRLEGFVVHRPETSHYIRTRATVAYRGQQQSAWVYLAGSAAVRRLTAVERIANGDWLTVQRSFAAPARYAT